MKYYSIYIYYRESKENNNLIYNELPYIDNFFKLILKNCPIFVFYYNKQITNQICELKLTKSLKGYYSDELYSEIENILYKNLVFIFKLVY